MPMHITACACVCNGNGGGCCDGLHGGGGGDGGTGLDDHDIDPNKIAAKRATQIQEHKLIAFSTHCAACVRARVACTRSVRSRCAPEHRTHANTHTPHTQHTQRLRSSSSAAASEPCSFLHFHMTRARVARCRADRKSAIRYTRTQVNRTRARAHTVRFGCACCEPVSYRIHPLIVCVCARVCVSACVLKVCVCIETSQDLCERRARNTLRFNYLRPHTAAARRARHAGWPAGRRACVRTQHKCPALSG